MVDYDISDVVSGRCRLKQALIQSEKHKNLFILPSCSVDLASPIKGQSVKQILDSINLMFDYVLIDSAAGIDVGFHRAISCADEVLIVVTASLTSLRDANKALSIIRGYKIEKVGVVVNRVRGDLIIDNKMMTPSDVQKILKLD
jgi:septum site-determining protein MinD